MHKILLAVVAAGLIAFGGAVVSAQTIDFESLPPGTSWQNPPNNPGDVVFSQDDIDMSVEEFFDLSGGNNFGVATIVPAGDALSPNGTQALNTANINVKKVSKKGGVGGPVALASGYENTYPLPNRPE